MTLEQLRIFIAVAEREHVTRAAAALHLTQAAVSASIAALEVQSGAKLFDRVGRNIVLTQTGRLFLPEAREVLARARAAQAVLDDIAGLRLGQLRLYASQTIASYFLPAIMAGFRAKYPGVALELAIGNTAQVARAVRDGAAELGFVEGPLTDPDLLAEPVGTDQMSIFVAPTHPWAQGTGDLFTQDWVFREEGSGTREAFVAGLAALGMDAARLPIALTLPSNEAVREAAIAGVGAACLSRAVCAHAVRAGALVQVEFALPARLLCAVRHKQRYVTQVAGAFLAAVRR
jgi:DNA-binding transcriptional LysR family regulator